MKTVLVTGATSGIGRATAVAFAQRGYRLVVTGRREDALRELAREIEAMGAEVKALQFDVRSYEAAESALRSLPCDWRAIDILVNNAGGALGLEPIFEGDRSDWDTMVDANVKGLLYMTRLIVPGMVERQSGHIINIGSVAGDAAYAGGGVYCATKAAVKALTDGLRLDLVSTPLRVTNIKPGLVETNFSVTRFHGDTERASNVYKGIVPLRGEDIASVVVYAAEAPAHVQIAEVLVLATHQANGSTIYRKHSE